MTSSTALKQIFTAGRPLVEQWLDVAEQMAALRDTATAKGLDWSQIKALLKAQVQDERDEKGDGKRVNRIVEKAEFACAYADMLGLGNMNEEKYSAGDDANCTVSINGGPQVPLGAVRAALDIVKTDITDPEPPEAGGAEAGVEGAVPSAPADGPHDPETGEVREDDDGLAASERWTFDETANWHDDENINAETPSSAPVAVPRGEEAGEVPPRPPASTFDAGPMPAFLDRRAQREASA